MRLIDAEDLKARAREEIGGMEEPLASQFAILVEWLVDKTATAYDVEKVLEQIKYKLFCRDLPTNIVDHIVRKGGVE